MEIPKRAATIAILAICVAYILFRFWRLTDSCLWFDEIFSVHAAEHPWGELFWFVAQDLIHPPLFYVLLKFWIGIGGDSIFWLRLLPILFSIVALVPFVFLCRELKLKTSATLLALTFFAANGSLIKYAQEVRMYSLLLCLSLFSIWLFARFFFRGKNIWILTVVNILLVYTHYFGWFVICSEITVILILQRIKIRHVLIMVGIALVSYTPWIIAILKAANTGADVKQNIDWIAAPNLRSLIDFVFDLIEPFYFQQSSADVSTHIFITLPLLIIIASAKILYLLNWKNEAEKDRFYMLSILSIVPLVLAFVLSWLLPVSIWGSRHLIVVFAPVMIIVTIYITDFATKSIRYVFVAAIAVLIGIAFVFQVRTEQPKFIWCSWESLAHQLILTPHYLAQPKPLYVFEDLVAYHFWFATRELPNFRVALVGGIEGIPNDPAYFLPRGFDEVERVDIQAINDPEIWIAFRQPTREEQPGTFPAKTFEVPISGLGRKGYEVSEVRSVVIGSQTAYLIKMIKDPRFQN